MTLRKRMFPWRRTGDELSSADLLRECGRKLTDRALWEQFQDRFRTPIFIYLLRSLRQRRVADQSGDLVTDLAQDFYVRLVQHDGRPLRQFKGNSEFSVLAF